MREQTSAKKKKQTRKKKEKKKRKKKQKSHRVRAARNDASGDFSDISVAVGRGTLALKARTAARNACRTHSAILSLTRLLRKNSCNKQEQENHFGQKKFEKI
jgi:hypothetical protein